MMVGGTLVALPPSAALVATPGVVPMLATILTPMLYRTRLPFIPTGMRFDHAVIMPGIMALGVITRRKRCRRIVARLMMALLVAMAAVMAIMTVITRHDINGVRLRAVIGGRIMTIMTAIPIATAAVYRATG